MNTNNLQLMLYSSLFILLTSSFSYAAEPEVKAPTQVIYSLFSGTITLDKDQLILHHCTLGKDLYLLEFNHAQDEKRIRTLLQQEPNFWLNLRASAYLKNEKRYLSVDGIAEIHPKESCHLSKLLSDLNKSSNIKLTNRKWLTTLYWIPILPFQYPYNHYLAPPSSWLQQYNPLQYHLMMNQGPQTGVSSY